MSWKLRGGWKLETYCIFIDTHVYTHTYVCLEFFVVFFKAEKSLKSKSITLKTENL